MQPLEYRVLGGLEARRDDGAVELGPPKQRAVLAVLALEAGRVVPVERLLALLWGDDAEKAEASLHTYVSNLRKVIEPARRPRDPARVLLTRPPGYLLAVDRAAVDAHRFEDLVESGRRRLAAGDHAGADDDLREALALWRGPLLPELASAPWVVAAARRLQSVRAGALEARAEALLALGDAGAVVALLEPSLADHPLHEHLHALQAQALYRSGRQAEALRLIAAVRQSLADATGLEPGPELRLLETSLLAQAPELGGVPPSAGATPSGGPPRRTPSVPAAHGPIVGREDELAALAAALTRTVGGQGGIAIVVGEPGIGKTRLVEELAARAASLQVATVWARCPEDGAAPPFWPMTQLGEQLRSAGVTTARLVAPPADLDANEASAARFALHRAVVAELATATAPTLAVIDDLQWADADSLRLLAAVAADLPATPVLVVATVRPLTDTSPAALVEFLGEATRSRGSLHLPLGGLDAAAVDEWLATRRDVAVAAGVAQVVHDRTGGNPLFVKELTEMLAAEGRLGDLAAVSGARAIPTGVQFVVRRRVARLPEDTRRVLSVAAVVGREVPVDVLAVAAAPDAVLDALEPACAAGLLELTEDATFRFSHALVADALAAEVNAARRARVHATVARALGGPPGSDYGPRAALVAHHATEGAVAGTADLAIDASKAAAALARSQLADEDATAHFRRAALLLERHRPADLAERMAVLVDAAATALRTDLLAEAHDAVLRAIELAEQLGDADAMARAAALLDTANLWANQGYLVVDERVVRALQRTLAAMPEDPTPVRARVLNALTFELSYDIARARAVCAEAERVARSAGDPAVLARALIARHGIEWHPEHLPTRRQLALDVLDLSAVDGRSKELELVGWHLLAVSAVEGADLDTAERHLERCWALAQQAGTVPYRAQLAHTECAIHAARGRWELARVKGDEGLELFRRTRRVDAEIIGLGVEFVIRFDRGGLEEVLDAIAATPPPAGGFGAILTEAVACSLLEAGRVDAARALVEAHGTLDEPPRDWAWLYHQTVSLHARAGLGRRSDVAVLLERLVPFAGCIAISGSGPVVLGLTDLALARGAALLGDHERAAAWFASAVAGHERLAMPGWLARTLVHQAGFLRDRGRPGDADAAREALARAAALADEHGLVYVRAAVDARLRGDAGGGDHS